MKFCTYSAFRYTPCMNLKPNASIPTPYNPVKEQARVNE